MSKPSNERHSEIGIFGDSVGMEMLTGLKKIVPKCSRTRLKNVLKNIQHKTTSFYIFVHGIRLSYFFCFGRNIIKERNYHVKLYFSQNKKINPE